MLRTASQPTWPQAVGNSLMASMNGFGVVPTVRYCTSMISRHGRLPRPELRPKPAARYASCSCRGMMASQGFIGLPLSIAVARFERVVMVFRHGALAFFERRKLLTHSIERAVLLQRAEHVSHGLECGLQRGVGIKHGAKAHLRKLGLRHRGRQSAEHHVGEL